MGRKMIERNININSDTCRTLVGQTPQAYFVSITIPQPKIRVKIPNLLMNTIQTRKNTRGGGSCTYSNVTTTHNQSKATEEKKKRGFSSLFSSVFGSKKPSKDEMGHQDQNLIKEKVKNKNTYSGCNVETASICSSSSSEGSSGGSGRLPIDPSRVVTTRDKSRVARSSQRKMASKRLVGVGGEAEMFEENGGRTDGGDKELCKKRILMGEKCKPLNYSGTLQYDKEGILLPDTFSW